MPRSAAGIFVAVLATFPLACSAPEERPAPPPVNPLDADWLDGAASIDADHLQRVMKLGDGDPPVRALFEEARTQLGKGDFAALARRFSACPPAITVDSGFTTAAISDVWLPRTVEDLAAGKLGKETEGKLADLQKVAAQRTRRVDHPDFVLLEHTMPPEICIAPRLTMAEAYEAIVHELLHALRRDPRSPRTVAATAADERAFDAALSQVPGGEVEAYSASTRARIRLGHGGKRTRVLLGAFDAQSGEPRATPAQLTELIVLPRPKGLGYADGLFRGAYAEARKNLLEQLTSQKKAFETALAERKRKIESLTKNVDAQTHNIDVHKYNLDLAGAKSDKALSERSRQGLADAERELGETRKLLEVARASEKRLSEEVARLGARIEGMSAR